MCSQKMIIEINVVSASINWIKNVLQPFHICVKRSKKSLNTLYLANPLFLFPFDHNLGFYESHTHGAVML